MSHTKEPWCLSGLTHGCFIAEHRDDGECEEYPVIWGRGEMELEGSREDLLRAVACVNACANLPEPEKNIRELVAALSFAVLKLTENSLVPIDQGIIDAVKPFCLNPSEEKKNADIKTATP